MSDHSLNPAGQPSRLLPMALAAATGLAIVGLWLMRPLSQISAPLPASSHAVHMTVAGGEAAARPKTEVKPISCAPIPNVPGKSLTTVIVHFPPNAFSPAHRHPGFVTAFVLSGSVRSQMEGEPEMVFSQGQSWHENPMALHVFAENASPAEPAELLVNFVTDEGCTQLVIPEKP